MKTVVPFPKPHHARSAETNRKTPGGVTLFMMLKGTCLTAHLALPRHGNAHRKSVSR